MPTNIKVALVMAITWCVIMLLAACSIAPPNVPVCIETNINSARCTTLISGDNFTVDDRHLLENKTYWQIRPEMILVPASSWVEIKKFILDICAQTHQCSSEVGNWNSTISTISDELDSKKME